VSYLAGGFTTTNNAGRPGPDLMNQTQTKPPAFLMDVLTPCGGKYNVNLPGGNSGNFNVNCAPTYPFGDLLDDDLRDSPSAGYPNFFAAEAFLGYVDYNTKTLTIFDGIDYGFNNTVATPEPVHPGLALGAIVVLWTCRRRSLRDQR
jgi:hypothetical protein